MGMRTHRDITATIDNLLEKFAKNTDQASDGSSSHPSANVDDQTKPAREGERSRENEGDVNKEVPGTINSEDAKAKDGTTSTLPTDAHGGMSTMSADDAAKGNVETPKKDHSKSMSDKGPGDDTFKGNWNKAAAASELSQAANELLAQFAVLSKSGSAPAQSAEKPAEKPSSEAEKAAADEVELYKQAAQQHPEDTEAGYIAAALLAQEMGLSKQSADEDGLDEAVAQTQQKAAADAEAYVAFLQGFSEKMAQDAVGAEGVDAGMGEDPALMLPPELLGEEAELGGVAPEELADVEDPEAVLEEIAIALDEAGVTPEELAEAVAEAELEGGLEGVEGVEGLEGAEGLEVAASELNGLVKMANDAKLSRRDALRFMVHYIGGTE